MLMASVKLAEKVATKDRRVLEVATEISTADSPDTPRAVTPPIIASLQTLDSPSFSDDEDTDKVANRKRRSPASPNDEASPVAQRSRSILHPIDNSIESKMLVRSPTVQGGRSLVGRSSSLGETPSSFVGSPVKKKRRLSSIMRL